jgi:hypothetical protein
VKIINNGLLLKRLDEYNLIIIYNTTKDTYKTIPSNTIYDIQNNYKSQKDLEHY